MYNEPAKAARSEQCVVCGRVYRIRRGCLEDHTCDERFEAMRSAIERCINDIDDPASSSTWEDLEELCLRLGFSYETVRAEYGW